MKIQMVINGLLIIAAGVLLFAFNTGQAAIEYKPIIFSWQMLLIAFGFSCLFSRSKKFFGFILMLIGGFFILPKFNLEGLAFLQENIWPVILVIIGAFFICSALSGKVWYKHQKMKCRRKESKSFQNGGNGKVGYIDRNYVFSGANEAINIHEFKGGEINCVFGGVELDFTGSTLSEGVNLLEMNCVFGGITLFLPIDWKVEIQEQHAFGNFSDNRSKPNFEINEDNVLIIKVASVFGGGEIKNV